MNIVPSYGQNPINQEPYVPFYTEVEGLIKVTVGVRCIYAACYRYTSQQEDYEGQAKIVVKLGCQLVGDGLLKLKVPIILASSSCVLLAYSWSWLK